MSRHTFGPSVQAWVGLLAEAYRMSKRNIRALLSDAFGLEVSLGTVSRLEQEVAAVALTSPVEEARAFVRRQGIVHVDETGRRQHLAKGLLQRFVQPLDPGLGLLDQVHVFLKHDLLVLMVESLGFQPAEMGFRPTTTTRIDANVALQEAGQPLACREDFKHAARRVLRPRFRIASCSSSGTHTAVSSPLRCRRARATASRRSVLMGSPGRRGIRDGATTVHSVLSPSVGDTPRCPHGPAS